MEMGRVALPRKLTVRDVAAQARVSVGTVSHVLTGSRRVAPETRRRVEDTIAALGYRPNRVARSLILRRTRTLAMVIPDVANPFFADLVRGVEDVAREHGYSALFGNSDNNAEQEERYLAEFLERRVDGLLLVVAAQRTRPHALLGSARRAGGQVGDHAPTASLPNNSIAASRPGHGSQGASRSSGFRGASGSVLDDLLAELPVVALDRLPEGWTGDAVVVDNAVGEEQIVGHLMDLGHRRIAFLGGDPALTTERERRDGFERALARRGLQPAWISEGAFSLESGRTQLEALLVSVGCDGATAIVAANDLLALGALLGLREHGLRVPSDVSLVGFDDIAYARLSDPPLTTVRQPAREMGASGARLVFPRLEGDHGPSRLVVLRPQLIVRSSTGPPREG